MSIQTNEYQQKDNNKENSSRKTSLLRHLFIEKNIDVWRIRPDEIPIVKIFLLEKSCTEKKFIEMKQCQCT